MILIVSLLGAGCFVYGNNGFASWQALWMFPAAAAVIFMGLVLLFLLIIVVSALCVDPKKELESPSGYFRFLLTQFSRMALRFGGVTIHSTGLDKLPQGERFLLVSNHRFAFDPLIFYASMPRSQLAFIAKKEVFDIPLVAQVMRKVLCLPLDRNNDRAALKSILKAIQFLKEDKASIAIFPEGGTNKTDDTLLSFKNGAFKVAQKAGVPIVICAITNTRAIFKNMFRRHTDVYLDVLDVVSADDLAGCTTIDIGERVHAVMKQGLLDRVSTAAI